MRRERLGTWLEREGGARLRVDAGGLLLGRGSMCHVILADPRASRIHALVRATPAGPELLVLGKNPVRVGEHEHRGQALLRDGDVLGFPGEEMRVHAAERLPDRIVQWSLELPGGRVFNPARPELILGGDDRDDVVVPGWPPGAVRMRLAQGALLATFTEELRVDGVPATVREMRPLASGAVLSWEEARVVAFRHAGESDETTLPITREPVLDAIRFEFMQRGGRVELRFPDDVVELKLSELRARLLAALLSARGEYRPGDWMADEVLTPAIWPNEPERGRNDLNLLLYRLRNDLARAGVNPFRLLERPKDGGSTRIVLGRGTVVELI